MSTVLPSLYVRLTDVRHNLTEMIKRTLKGKERMIITRHGRPVVALVTMNELHRIWADEDYELYGPVNPETGSRYGAAWVARTGWTRPLFESEVIAKKAAEKAEEQEMLTRIEAEIKSWEEEEPPTGSAEDAEPVKRKPWWKWW